MNTTTGYIDALAIERQARAARAEAAREMFAALMTQFAKLGAALRPADKSQPRNGAFA